MLFFLNFLRPLRPVQTATTRNFLGIPPPLCAVNSHSRVCHIYSQISILFQVFTISRTSLSGPSSTVPSPTTQRCVPRSGNCFVSHNSMQFGCTSVRSAVCSSRNHQPNHFRLLSHLKALQTSPTIEHNRAILYEWNPQASWISTGHILHALLTVLHYCSRFHEPAHIATFYYY